MTSTKPARSDPDVTFHEDDSQVGTGTAPRATAASATWPSVRSASPDEPASPTPAATCSTTGRLRRLRHLINIMKPGRAEPCRGRSWRTMKDSKSNSSKSSHHNETEIN
ncbi:hypothetical protein GT204_25910 [Streptomyces sp. SID4919]|uniref:hypothetical protein n=1 Tax=Streptomyces sp. SID4919 TaxID=2690270 RepID=UPI0011820173|nr:hypothetical protein [Streptomyces sp. SID4919]MYY12246.1 hypothetical protein [Streptomyces sp. SID4919]